MKFAVSLAVLALATIATAEPGCEYSDLKKCFNLEYMISGDQVNWPKDDAGVVKLCNKLKEGGKCLKDFNNKCNHNEEDKMLLNEQIKALDAHNHEVCDSASGRAAFLNRAKCYGNALVEKELAAQHKRFVALVESIPKLDKKLWEPAICCADLYIIDAGHKTNQNHCDKETTEYLDTLIRKIFGKAFHKHCGDVKDFKTCEAKKLPPNVAAQFNAIIASNPTTQNQFALPTLYKLWKEHK